MRDALNFRLDNCYIRFCIKWYFDSSIIFSDTEAQFLDLHVFISDGFVPSKIYDKRDDFDFDL